LRVDCIRVTHPYATLGSILLSNLPFGLHVLGLPLAFILSQDQTLHSIFFSSNQSNSRSINPARSGHFFRSRFQLPQTLSHLTWSHLFFFPGNPQHRCQVMSPGLFESTHRKPLSTPCWSAINFHLFKERLAPFSLHQRPRISPKSSTQKKETLVCPKSTPHPTSPKKTLI
jgi:hypothetical protein